MTKTIPEGLLEQLRRDRQSIEGELPNLSSAVGGWTKRPPRIH
jgi:hypothetical protein